MEPKSKLKYAGTPMAILSKKASNIVTAVNNPDIRVVVTSPSFDGSATVQVAYPKKDLTEIVYAQDADAGETIKKAQVVHMATDGKLYVADSVNNTNVVGFAMKDVVTGDKLEYGALGSLEMTDWTVLTGGEGAALQIGKKYFLQADGTIKTVIPTTGWMIHVGDGATATSINIEIGSTPIKL